MATETNNRSFYGNIYMGYDYGSYSDQQTGEIRQYQNIYIGSELRSRDSSRSCAGIREVRKFRLKNRDVLDLDIPIGSKIEFMRDGWDRVSLVSVLETPTNY